MTNNIVYKYSYGEGSFGLVVVLADGSYEVYEIPEYGNEEQFVKAFTAEQFLEAKKLAESFI